MKNPFTNDPMLRALEKPLQKMVEPMFADARKAILGQVAGPMPEKFYNRLSEEQGFDRAQAVALWLVVVDALSASLE